MEEVKKRQRRRGYTRITSKNQATLPVDALRRAGLKPGDELRVEPAGPGKLLLVQEVDLVERHAGSLTGTYPVGYLDELRGEWR